MPASSPLPDVPSGTADELSLLDALTCVLGEAPDTQAALQVLAPRLVAALGADGVAVLVDDTGGVGLERARLRTAAGVSAPHAGEVTLPAALVDPLLVASDALIESTRTRPATWHDQVLPRLDLGRVGAVPLHTGARLLGVILVYRFDEAPFEPIAVRIVGRVARRVALAADHARASAQLAHARLVTAIEHAADAIGITDPDGRLQYVNPAFVSLTGYRREEAIGRTAVALLRCARHPRAFYEEIARAVGTGRVWRGQLFARRRDGVVRELEAVISPALDEQGRPNGFVQVLRDITDRRKLEARLAQADRLTSLGTLAAGVAHEVNNPLTYVIGSLELAEQMLADGPLSGAPAASVAELREVLADAMEGAERVRHIVRGLKDFARPVDGGEVTTRVSRAIAAASQMVQNEVRHRARLTVRCEAEATAAIREGALVQVVLNLLLNAAQAIRVGNVEDNEITVEARRAGDLVCLRVRDTGAGIDPEMVDRIFDPFFTTRRVGEGTGLGLSICHGIVKSVGGEIHVESEAGRGSELTVYLPAAAPVSPEQEVEMPSPSRRGARILLIDDEPLIGQMIRRVLGAHDVTVCTSGRDGLAAWDPDRYDVTLCDLMMPDVSGMELYEQARRRSPGSESRIVFITGGTFTEEADRFVASLPGRVLEKPFTAARLVAFVDEALHSVATPA